ncbi:MAG: DUF481 domain-containing protein, partial [Shewanella sp.]
MRIQALSLCIMAGSMAIAAPVLATTEEARTDLLQFPSNTKYDWVKLTSDEILRGDIKNLYDDKLLFDSDTLDDLSLDWEDILWLQSAGTVSVGFTDLTTRTGKLSIRDGKAYIDGVEFNPNDIMTIIAGEDTEANYWSTKITLGANLRSGNTEQLDYSAIAKTTRRSTESRFKADYIGNYSRSEGDSTANNHRLNSTFDWFISKRFYLRPVFAEVYKDPFLNLNYRTTVGSGVGYNIIDNSKTEWSISGGPAYSYTRYDHVEADQARAESSASVVLDTVYDTEITKDIDFTAQYRMQYGNQE